MAEMIQAQVARKIAVTGVPGSGKSMASNLLHQRIGGVLLDADGICRQLLEPGGRAVEALKREIGDGFFSATGSLDRHQLRQALFADSTLRQQVNGIIHPLARETMQQQFAANSKTGTIFLVEVPLLFEVGWESDFDAVVVVYAPVCQCISRLTSRDRISSDEAVRMLQSQWPLWAKVQKADFVIDNSGGAVRLNLEVFRLAKALMVAFG